MRGSCAPITLCWASDTAASHHHYPPMVQPNRAPTSWKESMHGTRHSGDCGGRFRSSPTASPVDAAPYMLILVTFRARPDSNRDEQIGCFEILRWDKRQVSFLHRPAPFTVPVRAATTTKGESEKTLFFEKSTSSTRLLPRHHGTTYVTCAAAGRRFSFRDAHPVLPPCAHTSRSSTTSKDTRERIWGGRAPSTVIVPLGIAPFSNFGSKKKTNKQTNKNKKQTNTKKQKNQQNKKTTKGRLPINEPAQNIHVDFDPVYLGKPVASYSTYHPI